ncbi:BTAD domain-containing putative transcriptional regulator [Ornithinimicrobium cerasi]|uniref:DNA-binding transcriptional activator of the SARP family n=1 Tax=Ornithinimicrobium cerasi TaxID=2248773 RepID=A0A285VAC0_9MICO|nr:BTAD domain-containing putative transcriptional regulator [Ornithinimicrobium cerasi]SOC51065.1 DNA-binding transcriptional activator of the SARP family [Ornithinimicrobium cerasi]
MPDGPWFELFGDVRCTVDGQPVSLPGGKPSLLLGLLLLRAGRPVRPSELIDGLWPEDPPASARALVHTYVSQLRRHLGKAAAIETVANGYRIAVPPENVDVHRLHDAARRDDPTAWAVALGLSAEPLLAGRDVPFVVAEQARVDNVRETLQLRYWQHQVALGQDTGLLPDLKGAVRSEPLREDLVHLLARALGAAARYDDGIAELDAFRRRLGVELGMDPSPAHDELRDQLSRRGADATSRVRLSEQPSEDKGTGVRAAEATTTDRAAVPPVTEADSSATQPEAPRRRSPRRRKVVAVLLLAVILLLGTAWWWPDVGTAPPEALQTPALLRVGPEGDVTLLTDLPADPDEMQVEGSTVWLTSITARTIMSAELGRRNEVSAVGLPDAPVSLAVTESRALVALGFSGTTVTVEDGRLSVPSTPTEGVTGKLLLAAGQGGTWVATVTGEVYAPEGANHQTSPRQVTGLPVRIAEDGQRVWVLTTESLTALPFTGGSAVSALRGEPLDLAVGAGRAWVVTADEHRVWRTDPGTGQVVQTALLPGRPVAVAADVHGGAWVALSQPASVVRLDPATLEPVTTIALPGAPVDLAMKDESLLVAVRPAG